MCGGLWYVVSERTGYTMEYEKILQKKTLLEQKKAAAPKKVLAQMERDFEDQFIFDSMALSGSSLTLEETKKVLAAARKEETSEKES